MCDTPEGVEPECDKQETVVDPVTGYLRVLSERCSTCIFRAGNPMYLEPGKLQNMIRQALWNGDWIICHQTLSYGDHPDFGGAICRGFFDAYGNRSVLLLIADRYDVIVEVPPPSPPAEP